jgi:HK97 family phage major capsid protein
MAEQQPKDVRTELEEREEQLQRMAKQMEEMSKQIAELEEERQEREAREEAARKMAELEKEAYERAKKKQELKKKRLQKENEVLERMTREWEARLEKQEKIFIPDGPRVGNLSRSDRALVKAIMRGGGDFTFDLQKDVISTDPTFGWEPKDTANDIVALVRELTPVANVLRTINMPTNPYVIPVRVANASVGTASEYNGSNGLPANTNELKGNPVTLTAQKLGTYLEVTTEEGEDSVAAALPEIKRAIAEGIAAKIENYLISGLLSGAGKNYYGSATATSADPVKPTSALEMIRAMRKQLGVWGLNPNELVFVCGVDVYNELILADSNVLTVDKYGPQASVLTGEVAKILGVPILVSTQIAAADGADTDSNVEHSILLFNKGAAVRGDRRTLTIKTDEDIVGDYMTVAGSVRVALGILNANGICAGKVETA